MCSFEIEPLVCKNPEVSLWGLQVDNQAQARAHRIGQTQQVSFADAAVIRLSSACGGAAVH